MMKKTLWRWKASVLACVVVATVFGASTALAGTGVGGVFNLGQYNTVNALSALYGSNNHSMLRVVNTNTGTSARGLSIYTTNGKPPIVVENRNSGTATNLNADKVDGHDAPLLLRVNSNGTLISDDTVATVTKPSTGRYEIDFNRPVAHCGFQATPINGPIGGEIAVYPNEVKPDELVVITTTSAGAPLDRRFDLVLHC